MSKLGRGFRQILWPSQKTSTLHTKVLCVNFDDKSTFQFTFQIKISHFEPSLMTELGNHEVATIRNSKLIILTGNQECKPLFDWTLLF
jgi:hypothetical protein